MADILREIIAYKRRVVAARRSLRPLAQVRAAARDAEPARDFAAALRQPGMALIAEIKKASPSAGVIRADFDPQSIARAYAANGAAALSVVTDEAYFLGCDLYLQRARQVVGVPVLRKDFTIDEYQVVEARALGADAVLLIAAAMDGDQLTDLVALSGELGMAALVEVHGAGELARAAAAGAQLIGINNRDLRTFATRLETTLEVRPQVPRQATLVSESGIHDRRDVLRLAAAGVDAVLVGEALMRRADIGAKVRELLGTLTERQGQP
jgi:indole-3-glycerol phosphate synthase